MASGKTIEFDLSGVDKVTANLTDLAKTASVAALRALREEAEIIMTTAKIRTPVDTGALRGSGHVTAQKKPSGDLLARLEFGNASIDYALIVHENTTSHHPVGQAKYLESAMLDALPNLPDRIGKRLASIVKGSI